MTTPSATDLRNEEDPRCVSGCKKFSGGEVSHHEDCPFYPESLTKLNADTIASLREQVRALQEKPADIETLVWHQDTDGRGEIAVTTVGQYAVFDDEDPRWAFSFRGGYDYHHVEDIDAARAGAQKHYEERVLRNIRKPVIDEVAEADPVDEGPERFDLKAQVWFRESTEEWVLELSGAIDDCFFTSRHTAPKRTRPENVAGLSHLYGTVDALRVRAEGAERSLRIKHSMLVDCDMKRETAQRQAQEFEEILNRRQDEAVEALGRERALQEDLDKSRQGEAELLERIDLLEAEKLKLAQQFDKHHGNPALMSRIIIKGFDDEIRADQAEAAVVALRDQHEDWMGRAQMAGRALASVLDGRSVRNADEIIMACEPKSPPASVRREMSLQKIDDFFDWVISHKASVLSGMSKRERSDFTDALGKARVALSGEGKIASARTREVVEAVIRAAEDFSKGRHYEDGQKYAITLREYCEVIAERNGAGALKGDEK